MGKRAVPYFRSQKVSLGLTRALALAVSEWMLMFMLFIDACFSYLVTKFACYCELEIPCLLCSRLDHVLGEEKTGFYWDLMCGNHKSEISSLVLCHVHNKLVDVHGMCEHCLFSFATTNKSNAETYRLLVGKMGSGPHVELNHDPLLKDHTLGSSGTQICACCNERWMSRGHPQNLLRVTSIGSEAAELDASSSVKVEPSRNGLKTISEEAPASYTSSRVKKIPFDPLSHVEYQKVKLSSDTESEVPFSDDDSASALIRERDCPKDDLTAQLIQVEPRIITIADDLAVEKSIDPDSVPETSVLKLEVQKVNDPHGLEELNWQQDENKAHILTTAELISFDEVSPSSYIAEAPAKVSVQKLDAPGPDELKSSVTVSGVISKTESEPISATETSLDMNPIVTTNGLLMSNSLDLGDAYKLATIGSKGRPLSGKLLEQRSLKDSARVSEDLKLLLSQISSTRGIELSLNDTSPKVSWNGDEIKSCDTSSSIGMQLLQRRISLERNESGLSLDGSTVSEIDGESVVDRLKRQVEHDKKLMGALYKELEEERNASAVATYQAMAMITRLQEEKAALHMEALQCLRMMEEQAEYDGEALQRANDLLADKEKELLYLETQLHLYKKTSTDLLTLENVMEPDCDVKSEDMREEAVDSSCGLITSS